MTEEEILKQTEEMEQLAEELLEALTPIRTKTKDYKI